MLMVVRVKFQRMPRRGGGRTEASTEYLSHDILVEYYSQDYMMRMTFQNDPEDDECDSDREDDYDD